MGILRRKTISNKKMIVDRALLSDLFISGKELFVLMVKGRVTEKVWADTMADVVIRFFKEGVYEIRKD